MSESQCSGCTSEKTESLELNAVSNILMERVDMQCKQITDQQAAIEAEIHKTIQCLHQTLDTRRTELIGQLDHMTQQKLKKLASQRDEVKLQLNSCLKSNQPMKTVREVKKTEVPLMVEQDTALQLEKADMNFTVSSSVLHICQQFGKVYCQQVSPSNCFAKGNGIENAVSGERATAIVHAIDSEDVECENSIENVNCELVSDITGEKTKCGVKQLKESQYEISYKPTTRGRHQLHIKVEDEHIKGSPFTVMVKLPAKKLKFSTPIKTIGGLNYPWGVAVNKRGEVIVAEYEGHCISIFSPSGERIRTIMLEDGNIKYPSGLTLDGDDNILVADGGNRHLQKLNFNGRLISAVDRKIQFSDTAGVLVHPHNKKVYVADHSNHRVLVLNPDLTFSNSFGSCGSGSKEFRCPRDVAVDNTGNVFIADGGNHRVQVFTADGQFLRKFGKYGRGDGELYLPTSITIDSDNVVYVTEWCGHRVSVFTCEGQFLTTFGSHGYGPGEFDMLYGVAVDQSGVVYVCDHYNGCIQLF